MPSSGFTGCAASPAVLPIVLRRDADDDAGVGVALVARVLAHAVGDDAALLGRGGDHRAARAHAEAVDRAAVAARGAPACSRPHRGSDGRRSGRSARGRSGLAGARCESRSRRAWPPWLTPRRCSICEGVARAVAERQHDVVGAQLFAAGQHHAAQLRPARPLRSAGRPPAGRSGFRRPAPRSRRASSRPCSTRRKVPMCGLAT